MDIYQWYLRMLQAGNWYDVVRQTLQEPLEENATRDVAPPLVTYKGVQNGSRSRRSCGQR